MAAVLIAISPGCGDGSGSTPGEGSDEGGTTTDAAPASDGAPGNGNGDAGARGDAGPNAVPPGGPRPFYVVGHNPNSIADALTAIKAGANALEPDINVYSASQGELCVSHGEGDPTAPTLVKYLTDLHAIAVAHPELALVVLDCKPKTATAAFGTTILNAVRENLTFDTNVNVILSVSALSSAAIFDGIKGSLTAREGVMIDEENDPVAVSDYFTNLGIANHSFGNGISVLNDILGPNVRPSLERGCEFRAEGGRPKFIYAWTVNDAELSREYMRIGVDGLISDDIAQLSGIVKEPAFKNQLRLATRADNPMTPENAAYGLTVYTGNVGSGGTDANVTFTLTGLKGSSSVTVNTELVGREESGDTNFITLPSIDLGDLQSITVQRDNSGNGPDWYLDQITVKSQRFGVSKVAVHNGWIDKTTPFVLALK